MNAPITAEDLNRLPEASIRAILGNAVMVAQEVDPDNPTGRTVLAEIRVHLSRRQARRMEVEDRLAALDAKSGAMDAENLGM